MSEREAPMRVQLSRRKGWKMPPNTVVVSRPTRWGNPWQVSNRPCSVYPPVAVTAFRTNAIRSYRAWLAGGPPPVPGYPAPPTLADIISALRGKNLACWCPLDQPCHADVLLELANA